MDKYDCYETNDHDLKIIANEFIKSGNILFVISSNKGGCYTILLNDKFYKLGTMPWGGNPSGKILVSVLGMGCHHLHYSNSDAIYISAKLQCHYECAGIVIRIFDTIQMLLRDGKK